LCTHALAPYSTTPPLSPTTAHATLLLFFFNDPATTEIYTLSLHDALPICLVGSDRQRACRDTDRNDCNLRLRSIEAFGFLNAPRSEEHTSELQSLTNLVCRLLLEKKKHNAPVKALHHTRRARHYRDYDACC